MCPLAPERQLPFGKGSIDRIRTLYGLLVIAQVTTIVLYELNEVSKGIALVAGLSTSAIGPFMSIMISLHVFRHRRRSKLRDIAGIAISYVFTCSSFAIIYFIISKQSPAAFNLPGGSTGVLDLGSAAYFSIVTITTTGYGDISPSSGLARLAACGEIGTGIIYQVVVFSLLASLLLPSPRRAGHDDEEWLSAMFTD